jgi:hypothetical protein
VLILGSSRALQISAEWFQPRTMFNAAVPHGGLDDMIAFFQVCLEAGKPPHAVVIELNPALRREQEQGDHRLLTPYFNRALERYRVFPFLDHLIELSSLRQFRLNLQRLRPPAWGISREPVPQMAHVFPDGTASYASNQSNTAFDESEVDVVSRVHHLDREKLRWRTNSEPDPFDLKLLRYFLDDLQLRGIQVVILLPPVHPGRLRLLLEAGRLQRHLDPARDGDSRDPGGRVLFAVDCEGREVRLLRRRPSARRHRPPAFERRRRDPPVT